MTAYICSVAQTWSLSAEADLCFQRILRTNLLVFLLLGIVIPYLPLTGIVRPVQEEPPPRLVKLLLEKKPVPPPPKPEPVINRPKPVPKPVKKPQPAPTPVLPAMKKPQPLQRSTPKPVSLKESKPVSVKKPLSARRQAEQAGLLAMKETLQDLRQNTKANSLQQAGNLMHGGSQASKSERAILTVGITHGSDGINTARLSRNTGGAALANRVTTHVYSPVSSATVDASASNAVDRTRGKRLAGRSIEEIQMVFDRNKGAIYSVYNRALRKDPDLHGKVVLQLTIAPSGKVTYCELVSSELHDPVLGRKIAQRVKMFDFGARDVSEVTITYPIDFLPA
jgi:outer membrane biosynthesis protein TonB